MNEETEECYQEAPHDEVLLWQDDAPEGYRASVRLLKWHDKTRVPTLRMAGGGRVMDVPYTSQTMPIDHECQSPPDLFNCQDCGVPIRVRQHHIENISCNECAKFRN